MGLTLYIDTETFCDVPITHGTHAYAEHAEVLLVPYAYDDEPATVLDLTDGATLDDVAALLTKADEIVIHNSAFDRTVLRHRGIDVPLDKTTDTMALALLHSLPGSLDALCEVLKVPRDKAKDKDGKRLIHLFTKPLGANRKLDRATRETHPEDWANFIEYARLDVEAMREVRKRLPKCNETDNEIALWRLDQRINERGVAVDTDLATAALRAAKRESDKLAERMAQATDGIVNSATQRDKTLAYLRSLGMTLDDLKGGTIDALIKRDDLTPEIRELLTIRSQASATSPAKYRSLLQAVSSDGRLRGTLQFCGASRTGRWGGRLFQPQNLPRPTLPQARIDLGIEAMKADVEDVLFDNVMELCTSAVRGCLVAEDGKKLVIADLSNIEGRMLAWLANERWKLDAFRAFDNGNGHDIYKLAYAKSFNIRPEDVSKDQRQLGKVQELALGYQGAIGAFSTMAALYGVNLPEATIQDLVRSWRKAHSATVKLWYDSERSAISAVREPGRTFYASRLKFVMAGGFLRAILPSGRSLCYPSPTVVEGKLTYLGTNQYTRKWERLPTYGGKLVENATQAASRDVLAHGMKLAEDSGYKVVLHVHDELLCEVPDTDAFNAHGLSALMSSGPEWAHGLPLAADGYETKRYRKG